MKRPTTDTPDTTPATAVAAVAAQAVVHAAELRATARAAQVRVAARAARFRSTVQETPLKPITAATPVKHAAPGMPLKPIAGAAPAKHPATAPLQPAAPGVPLKPIAGAAPVQAKAIVAPLQPDPLAALRRIRAAAPDVRADADADADAASVIVERCELCAVPVSPEHRHVVNLDSRALLCACRPCSLLFEHAEAKLAFRTIPDRHLALPPLPRDQWDSLDVPVGLAFIFRNSRQGRTVVCYPGPAGATEADLPTDASEAFGEAVPDVEAVLIRARHDGFDRFIVPIDVCYALVGHLRTLWRGFDGGPAAHARVAEFFADIERKAVRPA